MGTVLRVRYDAIPAGRYATQSDLFADLGATSTCRREGPVLVVELDVDLSDTDREIAATRLLTPDDDQAVAAIEAADTAADVCLWVPPEGTDAERIAALEEQVAALTTICTRLAQLIPNVPL